ncbi:MAG: hypothetical protein ACYST9_07635, partial [Planctomycetota bacterium]
MFYNLRSIKLLCCWLTAVLLLCITGCSKDHYKKQADKQVYRMIDQKWDDDFGEKTNYVIGDVDPKAKQPPAKEPSPTVGTLNLAQSVEAATKNNRDYQTRKEQLYLTGLDLTLARHQFARQWFGTIDSEYERNSEDEQLGSGSELGFTQRLADGAVITAGIALDWATFLTGDAQTSLDSILSAAVRQPLLRGAGRKVVQEQLTQAQRNLLYEIRSFNRFRKSFVVDIVSDYYRVLRSRDSVTNAKNNHERLIKLTAQLEMEAQAGR